MRFSLGRGGARLFPGRRPRWRRRRAGGLLGLVCLIVAAWAAFEAERRKEGPGAPPEPEAREAAGRSAPSPRGALAVTSGLVARVEDGDTVTLADGHKVRYIGIDAPERDEPIHDEARAENRRLVEGRRVDLRPGGAETTDRYGRLLAVVSVRDGGGATPAPVNVQLVRAGLASVYLKDAESVDGEILGDLCKAQRQAILEEKGIWRRRLARARSLTEALVSTRFRIHTKGCAEIRNLRLREVDSLEEALFEGKSLCRSCRPLAD